MISRTHRIVAIAFLAIGALSVSMAPGLASSNVPVSHKILLHISYKPTATALNSIFTVSCSGTKIPIVGGTHPNRVAICKLLNAQTAKNNLLYPKFPQNMMCSQIYGGAETARVFGSYGGRQVDSTFSRTDGCRNARWIQALPLFTFPVYTLVTGNLVVSPTCPGPVKVGSTTNCIDPSAKGIVSFARDGSILTTQAINGSGFAILLKNGKWLVSAKTPNAMRCESKTLFLPLPMMTATGSPGLPVVGKGGVRISIACDTGMR